MTLKNLLETESAAKISMWMYAFILISVVIAWQVARRLLFHPLKAVPGPFLAKVLSSYLSLAELKGERAQKLMKLHEKYGSVVRIGPNKVSVSDWSVYREIYGNTKSSTKDVEFYGAATFGPHENIFSMSNHVQHSARRKLMAAPYSAQAMLAQEPIVSAKAELLLQRMISETQAHSFTNAFELCGLFSFEVICRLGFGKEFSTTDTEECMRLVKAMDGSAPLILIDNVLPFLGPMGLGTRVPGFIGKAYQAKAYWDLKSEEMVNELMSREEKESGLLLSPLLHGQDSSLGRSLSQKEILEEAMGIMFAGSGTTSTTLVYLLYALSRPSGHEIQEKLRRELQDTSDTLKAVKSLPYLNAVIKETFRLFPTIISTLPRVLGTDLAVGRLLIPTKTQVGMQNYVHHRDPTLFSNPTQFCPERWLESTKEMEGALTPFSVGPYNCIGQNLAWEELYLAVSKIFRSARLTLANSMTEEDMEMEDRFNIAPKSRKLFLEVVNI